MKNSYDRFPSETFIDVKSFIFWFCLISVLLGCSYTPKPTDKHIRQAIARCLQSEIPVSWVGNLLGGKKAKVSTVRVQKIGIYNKKHGYWPMKIRVAGTCVLNDPFNQGKTVKFDRVGDFLLYRDDYGEWQARLRGGMFQ